MGGGSEGGGRVGEEEARKEAVMGGGTSRSEGWGGVGLLHTRPRDAEAACGSNV